MVEWMVRVVFEDNLIMELVNLILLRDVSVNGM